MVSRHRRNEQGFGLIEGLAIVAVIAIIGLVLSFYFTRVHPGTSQDPFSMSREDSQLSCDASDSQKCVVTTSKMKLLKGNLYVYESEDASAPTTFNDDETDLISAYIAANQPDADIVIFTSFNSDLPNRKVVTYRTNEVVEGVIVRMIDGADRSFSIESGSIVSVGYERNFASDELKAKIKAAKVIDKSEIVKTVNSRLSTMNSSEKKSFNDRIGPATAMRVRYTLFWSSDKNKLQFDVSVNCSNMMIDAVTGKLDSSYISGCVDY